MKYTFSNRIENAKASAIREILKLMQDPEMISFGGGNPAPDSFPVAALKDVSNQLFTDVPNALLEYGISEGYRSFSNEALAFFSRNEQIKTDDDELLVTSGSQQIMDFMAKIFCDEGDVVICENPSFLGALNAFKSNGAKLVGCDIEADGIDIDQVEKALQKEKVKFIYVIPNFQNPTGITMSLEKRKALYNLAKKYNTIILEDNPYGDLRFEGEYIPSIKSLDDSGIVVYGASLSKIIAPGMRVALMVANKEIISKAVVAKQVNDVHTNAWAQTVMAKFLSQTDMDQHLCTIQKIYQVKATLMLSLMKEHFASDVSWTIPSGGMFIWVTLPSRINMETFVKKALEKKIAVVPGNAFLTDSSMPSQCFRMNFSTPSSKDIEIGIKILGELTKE